MDFFCWKFLPVSHFCNFLPPWIAALIYPWSRGGCFVENPNPGDFNSHGISAKNPKKMYKIHEIQKIQRWLILPFSIFVINFRYFWHSARKNPGFFVRKNPKSAGFENWYHKISHPKATSALVTKYRFKFWKTTLKFRKRSTCGGIRAWCPCPGCGRPFASVSPAASSCTRSTCCTNSPRAQWATSHPT